MATKQRTSKNLESKEVYVLSADTFLSGKKIPKISPDAFSAWIRALLQQWRQGTVATKGRADVTYSGKKPWKQKGTGRARAGTRRSPLWRGGGVIFGPRKRVRKLTVDKKIKKGVLAHLFANYLQNKKIMQLDWQLVGDAPSTAQVIKALKEAGLQGKKITFFVSIDDILTRKSLANIPTVNTLFFDQANAFDLSAAEYWVLLKKDSDLFNKMVSSWI